MKCSFCRCDINQGTGKLFILRDGTIYHFCSSKCEKNWKMKRNPKKVNWVRKQKKTKQK